MTNEQQQIEQAEYSIKQAQLGRLAGILNWARVGTTQEWLEAYDAAILEKQLIENSKEVGK